MPCKTNIECKYVLDYENKCDCSEDDKCGCSYPNNLSQDFKEECKKVKVKKPKRQSSKLSCKLPSKSLT